MTALIQLKLDGSLIHDEHDVSLRTLSNSMVNLQRVIDRTYLDLNTASLRKYAKLGVEQQEMADFLVGDYREGSFIIPFFSEKGEEIARRIIEVISETYNKASSDRNEEVSKITQQIMHRRSGLNQNIVTPVSFSDAVKVEDTLVTREYGAKSINNYVNELITPVVNNDDALLELSIRPTMKDNVRTFSFTPGIAARYKKLVKQRTLGDPVIYKGFLRSLDRGNKRSNFKGKFTNGVTGRDHVLFIENKEDYDQLAPFISSDEFSIVAAPIIEYGAHDYMNGDIQFLKLEN